MASIVEQRDLKRPVADISKRPEPVFKSTPTTTDRYYSREFMDREWEKVWTKTWQLACLTTELQKPGDFVTTELGRESIICTTGKDGKARACYNVCQHRGTDTAPDRCGHAQ